MKPWTANNKFKQISSMDATHNFTDEQQREWKRWLLEHCGTMIQRWGRENIPATLRVWINAVEQNLPGMVVTNFGEDRFGSGDLGPMFNMTGFGEE